MKESISPVSLLNDFFNIDISLAELNIVQRSREGDMHYDNTPIGAYIFASTRVDGVCYCILPRENDTDLVHSPVYVQSPMDFDEGTVCWAAKNFHDFLCLTLLCGSALHTSSIYSMSESEFEDYLKTRAEEVAALDKDLRAAYDAAIAAIRSILPKSPIVADYRYFIKSYHDDSNHIELTFNGTVHMREYEKGFYCHA